MNPKLLTSAIEKFKSAEKSLLKSIHSAQKRCKHKNIAECEYRSSDFGSSDPPMRVCLDCGMSEEGWGCGYQVLTHEDELGVRNIDRDKLYSLRHGLMIWDKEKGQLLRGEKTLNQLIDESKL